MKPRHLNRFLTAAVFTMTACAQAASLTWDSDATYSNGSTDGAGTWNNALLNWNNGAADVAWPNSAADTAIFGAGGTAGTVTVSGTLNVGTINFNSGTTGDYTVTGGTLVGLGQINGGGASPTVASDIHNSGTLYIRGGGTVTIAGAGANTGNFNVDNATAVLSKSPGVNALTLKRKMGSVREA